MKIEGKVGDSEHRWRLKESKDGDGWKESKDRNGLKESNYRRWIEREQ